jgi:nucleoside-diphosphate-sugar epimerase
MEGKPFEVWGGDQIRDFTFVDDAVEAFLLAGENPEADGRIFNLGGDQAVKLRELAELLVRVNNGGEYAVREYPDDRKPIDIGDYYADFSEIRSSLGWQPTTSLTDSLSRTLSFYRENLSHYL